MLNKKCTVEAIYSFGVFVSFSDGSRGYIRKRELSWDPNLDVLSTFHFGDVLSVRLIKNETNEFLSEYSLRNPELDPWLTFSKERHIGDVLQGTVAHVFSDGAWIDTADNIRGFLPKSEMTPWQINSPQEFLHHLDRIEFTILGIRHERKIAILSTKRRILQLQKAQTIAHAISKDPLEDFEPVLNENFTSPDKQVGNPVWIVDDDLFHGQKLVDFFERWGFRVELMVDTNLPDALDLLPSELAMIVAKIPTIDSAHKTKLHWIRTLKLRLESLAIILICTSDVFDEVRKNPQLWPGQAERIDTNFSETELANTLQRIQSKYDQRLWTSQINQPIPSKAILTVDTHALQKKDLGNQIENLLDSLLADTPADIAILFELTNQTKQIKIHSCAGITREELNLDAQLHKSPVADCVRTQKSCIYPDIKDETEKYRHLLDLLEFAGVAGTPIPTEIRDKQYVLCIFAKSPNKLHSYHLRDTRAVAYLIAAFLERAETVRRNMLMDQLTILGQFSSNFAHEIANQILTLEVLAENLENSVTKQKKSTIIEQAQRIRRSVSTLRLTTRNYQKTLLAKNDAVTTFELSRALATLKQWAFFAKKQFPECNIDYKIQDNPLTLFGSEYHFNHIATNLILNAFQHMQSGRGVGKTIHIETHADSNGFIHLHFRDEGPGIHFENWQRIFEFGWTTREDGSGQGLYVSQQLALSMQGNLELANSLMGIGSTFCLQIKIAR
ncbi:MAG TPA: ATP-binding protein [Anaerolineales bacterium]|nr:ATP-binding protein [Anaerolineales bacterium]